MHKSKSAHARWPEPPHNLQERLLRSLDLFENEPNEMKVLRATKNIYASRGEKHYETGLTLGDLRVLATIVKAICGTDEPQMDSVGDLKRSVSR